MWGCVRGTRSLQEQDEEVPNLIYILAFILLNLLITSTHYLYSTSPSSGIVAVLIAKAGHVYYISYRQHCNRFAIVRE